ncbi:MAG TPA: ABC transporter permease [Pseudonocardiaceae bacterium]|jgi:NitT/TauT family transport system permease protein|nr:ABC transporter permease [Pseudonocardiaceae bacterium]
MTAPTDVAPATETDQDTPPAPANRRRRGRHYLIQVVITVVLLAAWQLLSGRVIDPLYISSPWAVLRRLVQLAQDGVLWPNAESTFGQSIVGFVCGAVAGVIIGNVMGIVRVFGRTASPFVTFFYTLPRIAIAPLFVIWLGVGFSFKAAFVAFVVVFIFITPIYAGLRDLDEDMVNGIRVMGARRWTVIRLAILPQQVLWMTTTIKLAFPTAVATDIVAEFVASTQGLGYLMNEAAGILDTASLLAEVVFISVVVTLVLGVISMVERYWFRWRADF